MLPYRQVKDPPMVYICRYDRVRAPPVSRFLLIYSKVCVEFVAVVWETRGELRLSRADETLITIASVWCIFGVLAQGYFMLRLMKESRKGRRAAVWS